MTVDNCNFYVYRYEGELNDIPNAVVIISYPENAFGESKALRVFLPMQVYPRREFWIPTPDAGQLRYSFVRVKQNWLWINIRSELRRGLNAIG